MDAGAVDRAKDSVSASIVLASGDGRSLSSSSALEDGYSGYEPALRRKCETASGSSTKDHAASSAKSRHHSFAVLACHAVSVADTVTVASTPSQYEWQLTGIALTVTTMGLVIEYRVMHYGIRPNSTAQSKKLEGRRQTVGQHKVGKRQFSQLFNPTAGAHPL